MLRAIIPDTWFIDDIGKKLRMPWRETIVASRLEMEKFIKRIAIGAPGSPFLIGCEEVAMPVVLQRHHIA
jgi:hypothetical protein